MSHQNDQLRAFVTRYDPEPEPVKKIEEKKEEQENPDPPSALSD
tara:strand:- start:473 stop:604 length:132 start_codon:yes stop_codon:yes gene_type:complete